MSKIITEGVAAINNQRELINNAQVNLNSVADPNATKINASISNSHSGSNIRHQVVYNSSVDKLQSDIRRDNFTRLGKTEVIANSLSTYQNFLAGTDGTEFRLLSKLNELVADFGGLPNNNDIPTKIALLDKAEIFAMSINNTVSSIKALRDTTHKDMLESLDQVNVKIKSLHEVNQQLNDMQPGSASSLRLYSVRDQLLTELSTYFSIKVDFAKSGAANVTLRGADKILVSTSDYSRFSHSGTLLQEADNMSSPEDLAISLTQIDYSGKALYTEVVSGGPGNIKGIIDGKIDGYLTLRDDKLAKALEGVRAMSKTVVKTFNEIHNDGSTWPPANSMIGEMLGCARDFASFSGTMTISSLDANGKQLRGNGGRIHERHIDFDTLRTNSQDGKVTVWDAVNEFNRVMDSNLTRERAAIGRIQFQGAASAANPALPNIVQESDDEFLINNIMLASTSSATDIANGVFSFDFDIEGNSFFDSDVQIKDIQINGAPLAGFNSGDHRFQIEKDFAGRVGKGINVTPLIAGNNQIDITVVVKGDNGVQHTGKVRYVVDSNNLPELNKRVQYDTAINSLIEGDFVGKVANQTGVGQLRFIDAQGNDIAEGDTSTIGRLVYESSTEEHRVALRGSNLMTLAGLNNFFSTKGDEISVRSDIVADPSNMAGGQVAKGAGAVVATKVGDARAAAEITFGGNEFYPGDTIFIGKLAAGIPELGTAIDPSNFLGADINATLDNLVLALNADPLFNERFTASKTGANDTLRIEALAGGIWGNNVDVRVNLSSNLNSSVINNNPFVIGGGLSNDGKLVGGTDKDEARTVFNYTVGSGSSAIFERFGNLNEDVFSYEADGFLPSSYGTLSGRMSDVLSLLISQEIDANNENGLIGALADSFDLGFRNKFGVDRQKILLETMELMAQLRALSQFHAQVIKLTTETQNVIAAA